MELKLKEIELSLSNIELSLSISYNAEQYTFAIAFRPPSN